MEPLDIVLWTPIVASCFEVFDPLISLIFDSFLQNQSVEAKNVASQLSFTTPSSKVNSGYDVAFNADLLPLIFLNMRDLRIFIPQDKVLGTPSKNTNGNNEAVFLDNMMLLHMQTVSASPHPSNPISRLVLQKTLFEEFKKFGRGTRQALGFVF